MAGTLFLIAGPSGVGKTSLVHALLACEGIRTGLKRVVTCTSREPRQGEINGIDYHFMSNEQFEARISAGGFIEWSGDYGRYYGSPTSLKQDLARGDSFIMIVDHRGVLSYSAHTDIRTIPIWIAPPSLAVLHERLTKRGTENLEKRASRLALAKHEMAYDRSLYRYCIVNDDFDRALRKLTSCVRSAKKTFSHASARLLSALSQSKAY